MDTPSFPMISYSNRSDDYTYEQALHENNDQPDLSPPSSPALTEAQPEHTAPSLWIKITKTSVQLTLPFIAVLMAFSPVIFSIAILAHYETEDTPLPTTEKIGIPLALWLAFALPAYWVQQQLNGRRADGVADAAAQTLNSLFKDDVPHLAIALLASFLAFFNGVVLAMTLASPKQPALMAMGAVLLGSTNWLTWMKVELQASWRKYVEGTDIKALAEQPYAKAFYHNTHCLNSLLRETYPVILGLVHTQAFHGTLQTLLNTTTMPLIAQKALTLILAFIVYEGTALTTRNFDLRQIQDCEARLGIAFSLHSYLTSAPIAIIRALGQTLNGQYLDKLLQKMALTEAVRARVITTINAVGLAALLQRFLTTYLFSTDHAEVTAGNQAIATQFYCTPATTVQVSQHMMPVAWTLAIVLPAGQAWTRVATVQQQLKDDALTLPQVAPQLG